MKNAIKYYYNLDLESIRQTGKTYFFESNGENYILVPYSREEINAIYELTQELWANGVPCHQIIQNTSQQLLTNLNNIMYVLLKTISDNQAFTLKDMIALNNVYLRSDKLVKTDWFTMWTNKVDYFEYQVSQMGKKYKLITNSFSYYIGLAENAIWLMKNAPKEQLYITLNHRRLQYNATNFDLYNPLNFIFDYRLRDMCEYLKSCFFADLDITITLEQYLINLTDNEKYLFFARMLFPTYYFDYYEKIINHEIDEKELSNIIVKVDAYENLLKNLYGHISNLPDIEWLKKPVYIYDINNF